VILTLFQWRLDNFLRSLFLKWSSFGSDYLIHDESLAVVLRAPEFIDELSQIILFSVVITFVTAGETFIEIFVELEFYYILDVLHVFSLLLGCSSHFLILSFAVISEPPCDLLSAQPGLLGQLQLICLLQVRVLDVIQEPLLKDAGLVALEANVRWPLSVVEVVVLAAAAGIRHRLEVTIFILVFWAFRQPQDWLHLCVGLTPFHQMHGL